MLIVWLGASFLALSLRLVRKENAHNKIASHIKIDNITEPRIVQHSKSLFDYQ